MWLQNNYDGIVARNNFQSQANKQILILDANKN